MDELQRNNDELQQQVALGKSRLDESEIKYNNLLAELQSLKAKIDSTPGDSSTSATSSEVSKDTLLATMKELISSATAAADNVKDMKNDWSNLDTSVKSMKRDISGLLQYSRINSLLIHGLKNIPPNLHGYNFAIYIVNAINQLLGKHLAYPVNIWHLEYSHILPTFSGKKTVVLVKFKSRFMKHDIYDNRTKLKGTGISITEQLTPENRKLLNSTRDTVGFVNVWTSQTKILANLEGTIYHIKNQSDVDKLKQKCNETFPDGLPESYKAPRKNKPNQNPRHQPPNHPASFSQQGPSAPPGFYHNNNNFNNGGYFQQPDFNFSNNTSYPEMNNSLNMRH